MFYGLNKFIKSLLPKRLFYRALLIVAAPIIILQITISIVFFDSLWIKTNKGMTQALVGEIKTFIKAYDNETYDKESLINLYKKPSKKSEVVTQMIFGESFSILKKTKSWLKVKIKEDGYKGFIQHKIFSNFLHN